MNLRHFRDALLVAVVAVAGHAQAGVIINFDELPNEAGIHLTGFDISGNPIDVTKLGGAESFHISSPVVPGGYSPDAILSHIGISHSSNGYLVNILESPDGPISDQVHVYQFIPIFTVIDFISDPDQFVAGTPDATFVETGDLQNVLNYSNDRGELVSINVRSDVEAVPEPSTIVMWTLLAGVIGMAWMKQRKTDLIAA